jgi:hypothetical protein
MAVARILKQNDDLLLISLTSSDVIGPLSCVGAAVSVLLRDELTRLLPRLAILKWNRVLLCSYAHAGLNPIILAALTLTVFCLEYRNL